MKKAFRDYKYKMRAVCCYLRKRGRFSPPKTDITYGIQTNYRLQPVNTIHYNKDYNQLSVKALDMNL